MLWGVFRGAAAIAIHDRIQAPLAIGAQSVLAAAALSVQAHADVALPIGSGDRRQAKPVSCYFITVAATGERKTACDTEALWPVRKREVALREEHDQDVANYTNDKLAWNKARDAAIKRGKGSREAIRTELDKLGPAPEPPLFPILTCEEPTYEGLCRLFSISWPSLGIFSAEGGQFIGGHGMSEENKLKTAAGLSDLWDGRPVRRVRSGDGSILLAGRRLSVHLMAQPTVADLLFRDRLLLDQGLLSRVLVTAPDSAAGTRFSREERPETDKALSRYSARLLSILEASPPMLAGKRNELSPRSISLSPAAQSVWFQFHDHIERAIGAGGDLEAVRGLANKLPEHAARLAAVLTLVRDLATIEIAQAEIEAGIMLAEHYAAEALRLFGVSQINNELHLAQRLLNWLLTTWTEEFVALPTIYQKSLNAIRDKATAMRLVGILEDHGWLIRVPDGARVEGQHRQDAWRIVKD